MEPSAFGVLVCYIKGNYCIFLKTKNHSLDARRNNSREVRSPENYFFTFKPQKCVNSVFIETLKQKLKGSYIRGNMLIQIETYSQTNMRMHTHHDENNPMECGTFKLLPQHSKRFTNRPTGLSP